MNSLRRVSAIFYKELLHLLRDRLTLVMIAGIPLIQLTLFGFAINTDVRHLSAVVANEANTHLSRQMIADIAASQVVDINYQVNTAAEISALMDRGAVAIGLYIPPDFDRRVIEGNRKVAQIMIDGSDPIILGVGRQLAAISVGFDSQSMADDAARFEIRNYYNPERRSAINIVPGLIGVILTMTMVLFTSVAIVREKERGNLELLINTPLKSFELMLGKTLPYVTIGLLQVSIIVPLGWLLFQVPVRGSLGDVYLAALVLIATNLSLGLFISTSVKTQFQAMQMTFFFFLPSMLLSGFMFPFDGMPRVAQIIAEVLPLTHFNRIIRDVMLRGVDITPLNSEVLSLLAFMFVALALSVMRFSKRLD